MTRREFMAVSLAAMGGLYAKNDDDYRAPALFCAHGSPMNVISDNDYVKAMRTTGAKLKKPKAALVVSAHWVTNGLFVSTAKTPETIHDFYGFPKALYDISYKALGAPKIATKVVESLKDFNAQTNDRRGLDHGAWSVMKLLYPKADVLTFQLSLDKNLSPAEHIEIGRRLSRLRDEGVMIIGSGDIVHNLYEMERNREAKPKSWALEFETKIKEAITNKDFQTLAEYLDIGEAAKLSCPTNEHFLPLLYVAAACESEKTEFFYEGFEHASISLTSFKSRA